MPPVNPGLVDAFAPPEIAARVRDVGAAKAQQGALTIVALAVLGGAFISLGALVFAVVTTGSELGFGATRLLGGVAFSLGLILVIVAGAELFTGDNLVAMAWASRLITGRALVRLWLLVYVGNLVGALATVALVTIGGVHQLGGGQVAATVDAIAAHKRSLPPLQAFALAILCNALVCLAVWLSLAARSVTDKVLAIVFPIAAFVAVGFEHSIANMFLLPWSMAIHGADRAVVEASLQNLAVVTAGNLVGGTLLVAGVYWVIYLRDRP